MNAFCLSTICWTGIGDGVVFCAALKDKTSHDYGK